MSEPQKISKKAVYVALLASIVIIALTILISAIYIRDFIQKCLYIIVSGTVSFFMACILYLEIYEARFIKREQCTVIENQKPGQHIKLWVSFIITVLIIINPLFRMDLISFYVFSPIVIFFPYSVRAARNRLIIGKEYILIRDYIVNSSEIIGYKLMSSNEKAAQIIIECKEGRKFSMFMNSNQIKKLEENNIKKIDSVSLEGKCC